MVNQVLKYEKHLAEKFYYPLTELGHISLLLGVTQFILGMHFKHL